MVFLKATLLLSMLYIAYEDFRFRAISLYAVVLFFLTAVMYSVSIQGFLPALISMSLNLLIIAFELSLTWLYFAVIKKQGKNFVNKFIGMGDLLFYIPVLFLFSPLIFIVVHVISLLLVLIAYAAYTSFIKKVKTIPLAGGISITLILIFSVAWYSNDAMWYDNLSISDFLYSLSL